MSKRKASDPPAGGGEVVGDDASVTDDKPVRWIPLRERKRRQREAIRRHAPASVAASSSSSGPSEPEPPAEATIGPLAKKSLLDQRVEELVLNPDAANVDKITLIKREEAMLKYEDERDVAKALIPVKHRAKDITFTESVKTSWCPPKWVSDMSPEEVKAIRDEWHILIDGEDVPHPILTFQAMKYPRPVLSVLKKKGIKRPTPIQIQALPAILAGRDLIGIAFTGSGKTLAFTLPLVMLALEEELKLPVVSGEGPFGLIVCPSRELARQTYDVFEEFAEGLYKEGFPRLKSLLCIGGVNVREQMDKARNGLHVIVATPGRLIDMLQKGRFTMEFCRYMVLDEADRMVDLGFEEDVANITDFFTQQRQTLMFSATMPIKIQDFAKKALVTPVVVNVGRAGAANLDVLQEVEYVKQEAKIVYLLECLQKTPPPVLIFCENKSDVDDIHEYLLLKGVECVGVHGSKDQEDREAAISQFKNGTKDVLVATDVASKGLDFPNVQHVINYDMPTEIENYVHRIGRTGRCGKTGVATTFINKHCTRTILLDLKHLLMEAKQRIPAVLMTIEEDEEAQEDIDGVKGCAFCGGLGHRIGNCPKREEVSRQAMMNFSHRDVLSNTKY